MQSGGFAKVYATMTLGSLFAYNWNGEGSFINVIQIQLRCHSCRVIEERERESREVTCFFNSKESSLCCAGVNLSVRIMLLCNSISSIMIFFVKCEFKRPVLLSHFFESQKESFVRFHHDTYLQKALTCNCLQRTLFCETPYDGVITTFVFCH